MNTIKTLLLLSFSILLFNCSDEEDNKASKEPIAANGMVNISTMGAVVDSNTAAKIM